MLNISVNVIVDHNITSTVTFIPIAFDVYGYY